MAVIFDLDGVISDTASLHENAWKQVFDEVLEISGHSDTEFLHEDYICYLDGKTRINGIQSFLASRQLRIQLGGIHSHNLLHINGIANRKNTLFIDLIKNHEIYFFQDALLLLQELDFHHVDMAIGSSSKNARQVLQRGNLEHYFDVIVDGILASENNIQSKPNPAFYEYVAQLLEKLPKKCVVIEDSISGIISAKKAGIGNVIAIDRKANEKEFISAGADIIVKELATLTAKDLLY